MEHLNSPEEKDKLAEKIVGQIGDAKARGKAGEDTSAEILRLVAEMKDLYASSPKKEEEEIPAAFPEEEPNPNASNELKENSTFTVGPFTGEFDPKEYFRDGSNLKVSHGFINKVLALSEKVFDRPEVTISSFDLVKQLNDKDICANLPENHVFSIKDLWIIAYLIEDDKLLKNGFGNLFYVQVGASVLVIVVKCNGSSDWYVDEWKYDEIGKWYVGHHVFSRNG